MDEDPESVNEASSTDPSTTLDPPLEERERLQRREPAALERFYDAYFDRIYGYVRRLLREEHLAEDVTQDIFMHLHRSFASYDPTRALRPWVFTIATNKIRDHWRSRRHLDAQREGGSAAEAEELAVASERDPLEELGAEELGIAVGKAIEALPEGMRQTLVLRYYEGLSFAEIGEVIERNEVAVRKRYSRALTELRKSLEGLIGDESGAVEPGSTRD